MSGSTTTRGGWTARCAAVMAVLMASSVLGVTVGATAASADSAPWSPTTPATVTSDVLPTVQINGVVWDQVIVGTTVYATGSFSQARPAGAAAGTNQTARSNLLAYSITTGNLITTWAPTLNAQGRTIKASADGSTIYVGGDFTSVNGTTRNHLAAINATTGALVTGFNPNVNARVNNIAVSGNTIYLVGAFSAVTNQSRTKMAAVNATTGALLQWAPTADQEVMAVVAPNGPVVVGGHFTLVNGQTNLGLAGIDPTTGAVVPYPANQVIQNWGPDAAINSLSTNGSQVFGTGYGYLVNGGVGVTTNANLEATFSADAATGAFQWADGCLGDHYDAAPVGNVLYNVSHSHNCTAMGGHPQTDPWTYQRAQAETIYADPSGAVNNGSNVNGLRRPQLLHWLPALAVGSFTGQGQAAWDVEGSGNYVVMGGEFPSVNGIAQQGLVRFGTSAVAPNKDALQGYPQLTPSLVGISPGALRVAWQAAWDRDNERLTYEVLRGATVATSTVLKTFSFDSNWWTRPNLSFVDTTAAPGSSQTYRVRVTDPFGNSLTSAATTGTVPSGTATPSAYRSAVMTDSPTKYWRFGEPSGTVGYDQAGADDLTIDASANRNVAGALIGDADTATTFNGGTVPATTTGTASNGPTTASVEAWFKTTSTSGGKIVGFGSSTTGDSSSYDRHMYMTNDGRVVFGIYDGNTRTLSSSSGLNDGSWHHAVGEFGPQGLKLYVDGRLVGQNAAFQTAQAFGGYWRVGGDNLNGWPSQPSSNKFNGSIDDVAVYGTQLTQDQVRAHYLASGRSANWPSRPADAYGGAVWDANPDIYLRLDETSGSTAVNRMTNDAGGTISSGVTLGVSPSPAYPAGTAMSFDSGAARVVGTTQYNDPETFSLETWFKTTATGGRIFGFGNSQGQTSSNYDRHLYLDNGHLRYGIWTGQTNTIDSPNAVNDGNWHHVVITEQPGSQVMYLDGQPVSSMSIAGAQSYSGYWRLGSDNVWSGGNDYRGQLDEAAVYSSVLSPQTVLAHFVAGGGQAPNVNPTASFTSGHTDLTANFDATGSSDPDGSIVSYAWNFGDGQTGTGASPSHTYATASTYSVTLTVTDNRGGTGTSTGQVTVTAPNQAPTASFSSSHTNLAASFDASASSDPDGSIVSYAWDFGDGQTGTGVSPSHTYPSGNTYTVKLTVTDNQGATNQFQAPITVTDPPNTPPNAAFSANVTNLTVSFDGTGSNDPDGSIASYAWDFGDGQQGTGATPSHSYAVAGPYTVTLTVTDNRGATAQVSHLVTASNPPNQAPTASFTSGHSDLTANFNAAGSSDPDGSIVSYAWNFGDGQTGTGVSPSHTYATANTYTVSLTVTDNQGATGSTTGQVTVTNPPPANVSPTASFTSGNTNLVASFNAAASNDPDGSIVSYAWNFGDGQTGTGVSPSHTYATANTYTVSLTVTDNQGATGSTTGQVTVTNPPPANVSPTASFTSGHTDLTGTFDGTASSDPDGSVVSWAWNFGDGQAGTGATTSHTYALPGAYTVTLTVTDNQGATGSTTGQVTVTNPVTGNYASDTFSRTVASGLGTADLGGAWTVTGGATNYSVSGGVGRVSATAGASRTISLDSTKKTDAEVATRLSFDKAQTGGGSYVAVIGRRVDASNDYRLKLRAQAGGAVTAQVVRVVGGTETVIQNRTTVPGLTWNAGEFLKVRFQATGTSPTTLNAKVWKDGTSEPSAWTLTGTDATAALQVAGSFGIWDYLSGTSTNGPLTLSVDDFVAGPTGGVTPPPSNVAPTASFTSGSNNLVASFDASGSSDPDGTIASYAWTFGDGLTGTGVTPSHTYAAAGTYNVALTVTDNQGATGTSSGQVTVTAPVGSNYASDAFSRTLASGLGTADLGGTWTVSGAAANYSVSGGVGRLSTTPGGSRQATLDGVQQTNTEVDVDLSLGQAQTGGGTYVAVIGRRVNASNDYRLKLRAQAGGAVTAQLVRVVGGTETVIQNVTTVPGLSWGAGEVLHVRLQVSGTGTTNLAAKVWKDGSAEPAAWQLQAADTTAALQANGGVGIWHYLSGTATTTPMVLSIDNFVAGPLH